MSRFLRIFLLVLFSSFVAGSLLAEIKLESQLSSSTLLLGDRITLQLKVDGAQRGVSLEVPEIEGLIFTQLGQPSASSQTVIINGRVESFSGLVYRIGISASKVGEFNVPGIHVVYNGKRYQSRPFNLLVKEAALVSNMKLFTTISRGKIYLQQKVVVTLKWYLQDNIEDYAFHFPLLDQKDKLRLNLDEQNSSGASFDLTVSNFKVPFLKKQEQLEGETYTVYQVSFVLFPPDPGILEIPSASVKAMIQEGTELKKDFFGRTINSPKLKKVFAVSKPLSIIVQPIPIKNRPASYTGGVGEFDITSSADYTRVKVGDPIELTIKISGTGRLDRIKQPILSDMSKFSDQFAVVGSLQPGDVQADAIIFKQTLRPRHDGVTSIPPIPFSFFVPETESFRKIESQPIPIKVLPAGVVKKEDIVLPSNGSDPATTGLTQKTEGIYANYGFEDALTSQTTHEAWFLLFGFPPLIYLAARIAVSRRRKLQNDQSLVRARSAKRFGRKRLKTARALISGETDAFHLELSRTLRGYVSDKLDLGAGEVTAIDFDKLAERKVFSVALAEKMNAFLDEVDRLRFSGKQHSIQEKEELLERLSTLMKRLEKEL
jgi:BatD DUF11 like domain